MYFYVFTIVILFISALLRLSWQQRNSNNSKKQIDVQKIKKNKYTNVYKRCRLCMIKQYKQTRHVTNNISHHTIAYPQLNIEIYYTNICVGLDFSVLCISSLLLFGYQYQCSRLPGKTCYVSSGMLNPTHPLMHWVLSPSTGQQQSL